MSYVKLPFVPGTYPDDTPLAAEGFSVATNGIRYVRNKAQTFGGNEIASEDVFGGICRALFTWRDNSASPYCGIGTHTELDVFFDAQIYEITPIVSRGQLTNPFTTTNTSSSISAAFVSHGLTDGQRIAFPGQTTVNGADISSDHGYEVTVASVNAFTFTADTPATSSGGGVGGTVNYDVYLAPGLEDGIGGAGYGAGEWGVGLYGADNTQTFFLRTWCLDNWGQNLLACPRGGGIYEWAPNFLSTELVTNGNFSSATGWTPGTGWSVGAGIASATAGTSSDLTTSVTLAPFAYFLLEFDLTRAAGQLDVRFLDVTAGTIPILSSLVSSAHVETVFGGGDGGIGTLDFLKSTAFSGSIDNVTITQLATAHLLPGAPIQNTFMLVTPEQIVMVFGTIDVESGLFDPLGIRWSDTGRGDLTANQTWQPDPSNLSGGTHLAKGGRIVGARVVTGGILAWTDTALYFGRYVPDTDVVYDFQIVSDGCGLIGPNAHQGGTSIKWMTPAGEFMQWAGGVAEDTQSTVSRDISDHLSLSQQDKVSAYSVSKYGENYWLYPDNRDGNECSRYGGVNSQNQWNNGFSTRTARVDTGAFNYPISASIDGMLFFEEKGNSANGMPLSWSRETGVIPIGDGNTLFGIRSFFPNVDDWLGGFNVTFYMANDPNGPITTFGPYAVPANATKVDLGPQFPTGKFAQVLFEGNAAPAFAREGVHMIDIYDTGMVF